MHLLVMTILVLFALMVAYFCYSVYFYGGRWMSNSHNPRISSQKQSVIMGTVRDRDGTVLAYTDEEGARRYNGTKAVRMAVSHVIGDSESRVSTGVDTFHAQYMLGFRSSVFERVTDALTGTPQRGDDLTLTISEKLSRYITNQFPAGKNGAVVVMNYRTREVLAMVSLPQFDPSHIQDALQDQTAGALINRATQGLYPPGSVFKIVTLASALENLPDMNHFEWDCTGYYPVGGYAVTDGSAHGNQTISEAFSHSCNTAFAELSQKLGYGALGDTAGRLGFNQNFMFGDLIVYNSSYPMDGLSAEDLAWSSVGQGRVLTTPMHMALIASTIANGGIMYEPRLLKEIITSQGTHRALPSSVQGKQVLAPQIAKRLEQEMVRVVESGTGTHAALEGYTVAGKTGTAEVGSVKGAHSWFVGYVTEKNTPYAISVLVENGGAGGSVAAPLARKVLAEAIRLGL